MFSHEQDGEGTPEPEWRLCMCGFVEELVLAAERGEGRGRYPGSGP
jgi:hypothetical protein